MNCLKRQLLYCTYYCFPCCQEKKQPLITWSEEEDNQILQCILTDFTLSEIIVKLNKPRYVIEKKINDLVKEQPNYEPVYLMGPGTNYVNYIKFIKDCFQYATI